MAKRVAIISDATGHLGPDLALKLAAKDHDLVLGAPGEGLLDELRALGAAVAVEDSIAGPESLLRPDAVPALIDLAGAEFGGFDAAFVRPASHISGDILTATAADMQAAFDGNMMAGFYALQALIKALIAAGKGGQILIGTSSVAVKPHPTAIAYSAAKAGTNMLVRNAAQTAAPYGITVNAIGTMALNYPGFVGASGADDPAVMEKILRKIPVKRLGESNEIAHLAAALLDGENNFMTGEFLSLSGGWSGS